MLPKNICAQVKPVRRVLIFYELGLSSPSVSILDQQIRDVLERSPFQIELYREYLETTLFPTTESQQEIREWYIHKYRDRKPDLIMTLGPSPLRFLVNSYASFMDIPVVFGGLSGVDFETPFPESRFTGVLDIAEPAKTLEAGLRLQPATKHVVVVGGKDEYDLELEAVFRKALRSYESKLDITYLTDLAMPQLLERLRHLPKDTIILMTHIGLDAASTPFVGASQADPLVVNAANAPVFGVSDVDLGHGEVGGHLISFAAQGRIMGEMAINILRGQTPEDIPVVRGTNLYMFDSRALKRWGLKEKNLPSGSIVLNRQPTFWEAYKRYVIAALLVLLAQSAAIFALLWQKAARRKTQIELRKSEEKFSKAFHRSPLSFTLASLRDYRFLEVNDTFERSTGWTRDEVIGSTPSEIKFWVDTSQRSNFIEQLRAEGAVQNMEILFSCKDGQVRTGLVCSELIDLNGEPCALSVIADITDRKLAEEALSNIGRRLIEAHEEERTWIARELHDDINQRLALVAVELEEFKQNTPASATGGRERLSKLLKYLGDIGKDVQNLSHRLHSSKLDYLGLATAAGSFCRELSEQQKVEIDFTHTDIPRSIPKEISLSLFRVLQEALQNAVKHSGVRHFKVELRGTSAEIQLTVRDLGSGFDALETINHRGLGLISMRERLQLVNGEFSVNSQSGRGTTISARVPLKPQECRASIAG